MTSVEKTARTAQEAIQLALDELGLPCDQVQVEILEESRSLFGILGSTQARVRVTAQISFGERAARTLSRMVALMGIEGAPKVVEEDDSQVTIDIEGQELGLLIGKYGQTLGALQHLLGIMANRGEENRKRIILDAEGYRARREESLRHLALASARRAKQSGEPVTLDPLLPHERRIIHTTLMDDAGITTHSIGEDPTRRIVIEARGDHEQRPSGDRAHRPSQARAEPDTEPAQKDELEADERKPDEFEGEPREDKGAEPSA